MVFNLKPELPLQAILKISIFKLANQILIVIMSGMIFVRLDSLRFRRATH